MTEELPTKIKRVFKRLRIGELSLVDEACVPGSDVVVIKARGGKVGRDGDGDGILNERKTATFSQIKSALRAAGVKDYAFQDDGDELNIRFDDLPRDTPAFRAVLNQFASQMDQSDKGILFYAGPRFSKARKGGLSERHESYDNRDRSEGQWHPGGAQVSEAELIEKGLKPYADLVEQLEASSISVSDFLAQGDAMVASLMTEAETGGSPVAKSAANTAASMVMESVVDLKELNTAYAALEARVEVLNAETNVAKGRAAAAETALAEANAALAAKDEEIAKSKPAPTQAEQDEVVLKGLPEHLRAEFVQNRADREARDNETEVAKAREKGLPNPEAVGKALRTLRAADADALAIVEKAMYSAADTNKAAKGLMKSYGVAVAEGTDGEDDPEAALQAKADEVRKVRPELSAAQAYDLALDANPALYGQIVAKRRAGAAMAGQ